MGVGRTIELRQLRRSGATVKGSTLHSRRKGIGMWARVVERLGRGETVEVRPSGNSMTPIIKGRALVRLVPAAGSTVGKGDVVLAKVAGRYYLHLVSAARGDQVQISNNQGHVNGWTTRDRVYGIVTTVDGAAVRRRG